MPKSYRKRTSDSEENKSRLKFSISDITQSISPRKIVKEIEELQLCCKNLNTSDTTSNISPNNDIEINISSFEYSNKKRNRVIIFNKPKKSLTRIEQKISKIKSQSRTEKIKILDYDKFLEILQEKEEKKFSEQRNNLDKSKLKIDSSKISKEFLNNNNNIQSHKTKRKKFYQKRTSNMFDLNNFIVQNSTNLIKPKYQHVNIPIPVYKVLDDDFYEEENDKYNSQLQNYLDEEITSDDAYLTYHNLYENREREYRINFFKKKKPKNKTE